MRRTYRKGDRTVLEIMLAEACKLRAPFTQEELIVATYLTDPQRFGMRGFPQHPDANGLHKRFHGVYGLLTDGLLEHVGKSTYQVTSKGRQWLEGVNSHAKDVR